MIAKSTATHSAIFMIPLHLLPLHSSSTNMPYKLDVFANISGFKIFIVTSLLYLPKTQIYTETLREHDKNALSIGVKRKTEL